MKSLGRDPIMKPRKPQRGQRAPRLGFNNPLYPVDSKLLSEMRNPAGLPLFILGGLTKKVQYAKGNFGENADGNILSGADVGIQSKLGNITSNPNFSAVAGMAGQIGSSLLNDKHKQSKGAISGVGTGAAFGAQLGSVIPGLGTVIGAVGGGLVGGIAGWLKGKREKEQLATKEREEDIQNAKAMRGMEMNYSRGVLNSYPTSGVTGASYFKYGGQVPQMRRGGDVNDPLQDKKPLVVNSKNHPRYKAYQDSLNAYSIGEHNWNMAKKYSPKITNGVVWYNDMMVNNIPNIKKLETDLQPLGYKYTTSTKNTSNIEWGEQYESNRDFPIYKKPEQEVIYNPVPFIERGKSSISVPNSTIVPPPRYSRAVNSFQDNLEVTPGEGLGYEGYVDVIRGRKRKGLPLGYYDYGNKVIPKYATGGEINDPPQDKKPFIKPDTVNSSKADAIRNFLPLPKNIAQATAKVLFGDARMSSESLSEREKVILWDAIQNAQKRTGVKSGGGTEYQDYGNMGYGSPEQFNQWFNRSQNSIPSTIKNSLTNPGFRLASTIGRGRYWQDSDNPNSVYYTDVYDWNPSEKNFSGNNLYQIVRNAVRRGEDKNLNQDKNNKYRMNFKLDRDEIQAIKSGTYLPEGEHFSEVGKKIIARNKSLPQYEEGGQLNDPPFKSKFKVVDGKLTYTSPKKPNKFKDNLESAVAAASLITSPLPPVSYGFSLIGSGIDFADAITAESKSERNQQLAEGFLGLVPYAKNLKYVKFKKGFDWFDYKRKLSKDATMLNKLIDTKDVINPNLRFSEDNNLNNLEHLRQQYQEKLNKKSIQKSGNGGVIPQYEKGGKPPKRIERRPVQTRLRTPDDIIYGGRLGYGLPEATVRGQRDIVGNYGGEFLGGAGQILGNVLGLAGNAVGYGIGRLRGKDYTGEDIIQGRSTPSQSLNVENPVGAFVLDAALDPSTYIGGAAATGLARRGLKKNYRYLSEALNEAPKTNKNLAVKSQAQKIYKKLNTPNLSSWQYNTQLTGREKLLAATIYRRGINNKIKSIGDMRSSNIRNIEQEAIPKSAKLDYVKKVADRRLEDLFASKLLKGDISQDQYTALNNHSAYFQFLQDKNLVDDALSSSENIQKYLNDENLINEFTKRYSRSQRGVTLDKNSNKVEEAIRLGSGGQWGPGNYSSNSNLILDRFSTPYDNSLVGYQGQLKFNLPGIDKAVGKGKLDIISNRVANQNNTYFLDRLNNNNILALEANYGGRGSSERFVKKESFDRYPNILEVLSIKPRQDEIIDKDVLSKVGYQGLKNSDSNTDLFPYSQLSTEKARLVRNNKYYENLQNIPPDVKTKYMDIKDRIWKEKENLNKELITLNEKKNKNNEDLSRILYLRDAMKYLDDDLKYQAQNILKPVGISLAGSGTLGAIYLGNEMFKERGRKKRQEYEDKLNSYPDQDEINSLRESINKSNKATDLIRVNNNLSRKEFHRIFRDSSEVKKLNNQIRESANDPILSLKLKEQLSRVLLENALEKYSKNNQKKYGGYLPGYSYGGLVPNPSRSIKKSRQ